MRLFAFRRLFALFAALALLVSLQMEVMPAAASLAPSSTEIASQSNPVGCKNCGQQAMTAGECVAVCDSTPILSGQMATSHFSATEPDIIRAETLSTASVEPDLTPPRL